MSVKKLAFLAAALALFGCRTPESAAPVEIAGGWRVAGEPKVAYFRAPKALREAGLSAGCPASFDEDGKGLTVRSETPDGRKFAITFRPDGPDATRVGIVWDGPPDEALGRKIVAGLTRN